MKFHRREFLALVGPGAVEFTNFANAAHDLEQLQQVEPRPSDWPMVGHDPASRRYNPDASGPRENLKEQWRFEFDGAGAKANAIVDDIVYVGANGGGQELWALDATDGSIHWERELSIWTASQSFVDGVVVGGFGQGIYGVDPTDGSLLWDVQFDEFVLGSMVDAERAYVGTRVEEGTGSIQAVDLSDQSVLWKVDLTTERGGPMASTGDTLLGRAYNKLDSDEPPYRETVTLYCLDAATGDELWRRDDIGRQVGIGGITGAGTFYETQSYPAELYARTLADNLERWHWDPNADQFRGLAIGAQSLYATTVEPTMVHRLARDDGQVEWQFDLGTPFASPPAVSSDEVYVVAEGEERSTLYALDAQDGQVLGETVVDDDERFHTYATKVTEGTVYLDGVFSGRPSAVFAFTAGETSFRLRALVPPVFPIPGETLTAGALLESEQSHDTPATVRLSFDDEQVAEKSVSVIEGLTPIRWWADVSLTPGSHDLQATVKAEWLDGTIETTRTVDVPPLALTEVYTQPAVHRSDSGDADTDKKMTETVLEVENPTEETVTATFSLYTAERNGSTDDPELQGDPDERQEVTVNAGGTTRLYFLWELDSEATHQIEITMDISDDSSYLYRDAYSPLGIPMPTEIAYSAGTAPRGSGHSIQIAELVYHKDFVVAHDRSAVYVPMTGDGRNEIVIYDEDENVLGQTEQSVDTSVQGPAMEMIDPLDPNEWIEVPLEVDDSTQFLIVHIKEEKNVFWAIGKGFLSSPLAFARALDGLVPGESPKEEHGGTENADPNALRYEHMAVAELSGYPESPDLQEFSQEVGDREAAEYHWETVEQALTELPTVVGGFKSVTAEVISTFVSVVEGVAKETMDEITDAFGVHVSFSELAAYNDEELGKLTVYDYGTDDPGIGADREKLSHVRTVDVKTTGLSAGTADVTVHYDDDDVSQAGIGEGTLDLYYWDGESWTKADNVEQDAEEQTVSGTIDVPALTGTPVTIFGDRSSSSGQGFELPDGVLPLAGAGALGASAYAILEKLSRRANDEEE